MTALLGFQVTALGAFAVFVYYVFDIRKKEGMTPLIPTLWTSLMKLLSAAMLAFFLYIVATMNSVAAMDWIAVLLMWSGASCVAGAKITLGRYHTWVGYHKINTVIVRHGIYSMLRHPLYTGIFLFEFGAVPIMVTRVSFEYIVAMTAAFAYMVGFNIILAEKESAAMREKFGSAFDEYAAEVRAFVPIRKRKSAPAARSEVGSVQ